MVRILESKIVGGATDNALYYDITCLSTDTKPTAGVATGSFCLEVDTLDSYFFDEDSGMWLKVGGNNG